MKRVTLISIVWLTGWSLMAQPTAGKLFLGGNMKIYTSIEKVKTGSTTENNGTTTYLSFLPMAGYFLSEKIALGAGIGVDASFYKLSGGSPEKRNGVTFVFNPFARYYLISGTGGLFAEAFIRTGFGTEKDFYETTTDKQKLTEFSMGIAPGVYYYITSKLALEAKFGWLGFRSQATKFGEDRKNIYNTFGLQFTPDSFIFGLTFTL